MQFLRHWYPNMWPVQPGTPTMRTGAWAPWKASWQIAQIVSGLGYLKCEGKSKRRFLARKVERMRKVKG